MVLDINSLTVKEGLVRIVNGDYFLSSPYSSENQMVIVMQKSGETLSRYRTLRSPKDKLSIGEKIWGQLLQGSYVFYIVDLGKRTINIENKYQCRDHVTELKISIKIFYYTTDGEYLAFRAGDALQALKDEVMKLVRREVLGLNWEDVNEQEIENWLAKAIRSKIPAIYVEESDVKVDWPEEMLRLRKEHIEKARKQQEEDAERRRKWELEDEERGRQIDQAEEDRRRQVWLEEENQRIAKQQELENVAHIDNLISLLGLNGLPMDARLRLYGLPREQAIQEIISLLEERRHFAEKMLADRMASDLELLKKLIDEGVLEKMDLVELGQKLRDRYLDVLTLRESLGISPELVFGSGSPQARLSDKTTANDTSAASPTNVDTSTEGKLDNAKIQSQEAESTPGQETAQKE